LWLPVRADGADILHNVQDGVVRIKPDGTHKLEKHDPKWMFKGILPVNYGSKVRSRLYFDLLEKQLPDEKDRKLASLFEAYCLIPDFRFNVALICHGETHTGRSTMMDAGFGQGIFGEWKDNLELDQITPGEKSFKRELVDRAGLFLLNCATELNPNQIHSNTAKLKKWIAGEQFVADPKYGQIRDVQPRSKLLFLPNELPKNDGTAADIVRFRLIEWTVSHEHSREPEILEKIREQAVVDELYARLLKLMPELLALKAFPHGGENSVRWESRLAKNIDFFGNFLRQKGLELNPNAFIWKTDMDTAVFEFLKDNNLAETWTVEKFKKRLYDRFNLEPKQERRTTMSPKETGIWGIRKVV
jgi:phage/plasmid-associated DNA primase